VTAAWIDPEVGVHDEIISDMEAQEPKGHKSGKAAFYINKHEDVGAPSAVLPNATNFKTHSDFVNEAIAQGKSHEVHPVTMAMHKDGKLSGWFMPRPDIIRDHGKVVTPNGPDEVQRETLNDHYFEEPYQDFMSRQLDAIPERPADVPTWGRKAAFAYGLGPENQREFARHSLLSEGQKNKFQTAERDFSCS
jgi:hypothetical protein